jgi:hypothetical protein
MRTRTMGGLGRDVSEIGFGAWQIGADWGTVDEDAAMAAMHAAADAGVTFFDTADVYGDGRSERLVGRLLRERAGTGITVAERGTRGGGAEGGRVPGRCHRADHLQHVPPAARRPVLRGGGPPRGRGHRAAASELDPLDDATMAACRAVYEERIAPYVHQRW